MGDFSPLWALIKIFIIGFVLLAILSIYLLLFKDYKTIESKEKPVIDYRLKTNGKTIDTIWVYKFK